MRVVAIIQARLGSTRLPGKVLAEIGGRPMLGRVAERLRLSSRVDEIVVATTDLAGDGPLAAACGPLGLPVFCGSDSDVLDRYKQAAARFNADAVVRITADCPLLDPALVDRAVAEVADRGFDCACVVPIGPLAFPRGFDAEVFTVASLERAWQAANQPHERAHVTPYLYERPEEFSLSPLEADRDYRHIRLTVDTPDDLRLIRALHQRLALQEEAFTWRDCVAIIEANPTLRATNLHVRQKALAAG
ncbi:MAG: NTP transferase domain-containing protein [Pirellulales bacterium]